MPVLRIGRTPESGLPLLDPEVSRNHAELRMESQGLILTDLGSSNGTFIGTERLLANQPHLLSDGTTFRIGPFLLTYRVSKPTAQSQEGEDEPQPTEQVAVVVPVPVAPAPTGRQQVPQPAKPVSRHPLDEQDGIYRQYLPDIFQEND